MARETREKTNPNRPTEDVLLRPDPGTPHVHGPKDPVKGQFVSLTALKIREGTRATEAPRKTPGKKSAQG